MQFPVNTIIKSKVDSSQRIVMDSTIDWGSHWFRVGNVVYDKKPIEIGSIVRIKSAGDKEPIKYKVLFIYKDYVALIERLRADMPEHITLHTISDLDIYTYNDFHNFRMERQKEGIAKAKCEGKYKGRKPTALAKTLQVIELRSMGLPVAGIAGLLHISRASVYRCLSLYTVMDIGQVEKP